MAAFIYVITTLLYMLLVEYTDSVRDLIIATGLYIGLLVFLLSLNLEGETFKMLKGR